LLAASLTFGELRAHALPGDSPRPAPSSSAAPQPSSPKPADFSPLPWLIITAGLAVAGIAIGIGMTVAANDAAGEAEALEQQLGPTGCQEDQRPMHEPACSELDRATSDQENFEGAAVGAYVSGGIFGAVAIAIAISWAF
jgi:hypothetical protein